MKTCDIANEFGIGVPMVYMIQNGQRVAKAPQTSFAEVVRCMNTVVSA